jgi:hypothetical protein
MPNASLSLQKAIWYRRPWFIATLVVVLVVAISVITDLPHPVTKAEDTSDQNGVIKQINGDTSTCIYALKESFSFYREELAHTLQTSNFSVVKNYLLEDQTACSFASGSVYDMTNNIEPFDTSAGKKVDSAYQVTVKWITYDAVAAIIDIRNYFGATPFHMNTASLITNENALANERAEEVSDIDEASSILGTTLTPINIPVIARLPGT